MLDFEKDQLMPILADLLMGAAYADDKLRKREAEAVRDKLRSFLDLDELPPNLEERLQAFDPATFDLKATAQELLLETPSRRRKILELVAAVHDADEELDLDEDEYLRDLGEAMGLNESEYADLKLEILSVESVRQSLTELTSPPPLPKK